MATNLVMLQKEDLIEAFVETLKTVFGTDPYKYSSYHTEDDEYYTRDETCFRLHITFTTLWRMEKSGKIKSHKIGRRSLYAKSDVNALISNGTSADNTTDKFNH